VNAITAPFAAAYAGQGFTGVKFDPVMPFSAFDPRQLSLEALANAEKVVGRVREAVGDKCDLLIGTHGQMTTSSAIRLAKRLEKFDPLWLEEPVPPENIDDVINSLQLAFFIATLAHGLGDGILAGVLDNGQVANGFRHSVIMLFISVIMFAFI